MNNPKIEEYPFPLGARYHEDNQEVFASFEIEHEGECGIQLYGVKDGKPKQRIVFQEKDAMGHIRFGKCKITHAEKYSYAFFDGKGIFADPYAKAYCKNGKFGEEKDPIRKAILSNYVPDMSDDILPKIPYEDSVCYGVHVRGFTMHSSSMVKEKGTFRGMAQKIPYLKDLGITTLVVQPCYEFDEIIHAPSREAKPDELQGKINYWGYCNANYYAPKASFASGDPREEFADLVKELHRNHLEVLMQFYFPDSFDRDEILPILRFWSYCYHVDGFQLMGNDIPVNRIARDSALCDRKIWYYDFDTDSIYGSTEVTYRNLAKYSEDYAYVVRRFLKGEDGCIYPLSQMLRRNEAKVGVINFLADYQGFTLRDLFMYDRKHNEANGEDNRDGNDYNCSWNCGVEGDSRKKQVLELRKKLWENAVTLLFLSQGTPYLFMGDEFGRTQKGNNNPYCQDNQVTWLNWKDLDKNGAFYGFVKNLISFRREHQIFHMRNMLKMMDTDNSGYPDFSYHGESPWKPEFYHHQHHLGMMFNGKEVGDSSFWYVAINLHWESHTFSLPKLTKGYIWKTDEKSEAMDTIVLKPRSIEILQGTLRKGKA